MQLILDTQPTEGIKINMSTQAENSVNEEFSDIKCTNINNANKEINMDSGTVSDPEICMKLNNQTETEIDQVTPETINESALKEGNYIGNKNGKENKTCNQEAIGTTKKSNLIENINSILNENITKGTSSSRDEVKPECDNVNEKSATENILTKNKDDDSEINTAEINSTKKQIFESVLEKEDVLNNQHPKLELRLSDDTTSCLSKDIILEERSKMFNADAGLKLKEIGSTSNDKVETMDVIDTSVVNNIETENVTASDVGTDIDPGENGDKILTNDTLQAVHKKEQVHIFKNDQVIIPDTNILVNKENAVQSDTEVPTLAISTEAITLRGETIDGNETLAIGGVKDSEHIAMEKDADSLQPINNKTDNYSEVVPMDDDTHKQSEVHVDIVVNNKADAVTLEKISEHENLAAIDKLSEVPVNTAINDKTTTEPENITSQQVELPTNDDIHTDTVVVDDDDMNKMSQVTLRNVSNCKSDTLTDEPILEHKEISTSNKSNVEYISMDEEIDNNEVPEVVAINNETNAPRIDKQLEDVLMNETNITRTDNNEKQYTNLKNVEIPQPVALENDKFVPSAKECVPEQNENTSLELNGSNIKLLPIKKETCHILKSIPAAVPIENTIFDKIEQVSDKFSESNLKTFKAKNESVMSTTKFYENEDDDDDVEHVPMEVDEIEIVDSDKDSQDENSMSMTFTEKVDSEKTNVIEVIVPKITITEPLNKNNYADTKKTETEIKIKNANAVPIENESKELTKENRDKVEILDEDDFKIVENKTDEMTTKTPNNEKSPKLKPTKTLPIVCKLSNTLDILSDDEDEPSTIETTTANNSSTEKQCINIDDDDDIMLIEDLNSKDKTNEDKTVVSNDKEETQAQPNNKIDLETGEKETITKDTMEMSPKTNEKDSLPLELNSIPIVQNISEEETVKPDKKPLLPQNFLKTAKKNLADMTRDDLEDFCVLRIVESIVDRTNLSDIKSKIKAMALNLEDFRKRALMLTKQNRDLQVVLKSVQEEQKKRVNAPIQPLKITRSVGMQVLMNENVDPQRNVPIPCQPPGAPAPRPNRPLVVPKVMKPPVVLPAPIPVPRKVPVSNTTTKVPITTPTNNIIKVTTGPSPALRLPSPVQKAPEKRTHSRMQATQANSTVTVDLTDDEPPAKIINKTSPVVAAPVRLVPPQNLLPQPRAFTQPLNSPRKVYIPISGPQGQAVQAIRPGQTLMMRSVQLTGPRPRVPPPMPRMQQSPVRIIKSIPTHPAPLPDAMKQYTPPTWKSLPPAPDLKLSKVENGIVISWKIEVDADEYETVVSYQLYAYQETPTPPSSALWKKIGDVKALPLPMACTLTQFMAGFKYYFAVRAVDIRSRLGAFSKPGSILLLNKV